MYAQDAYDAPKDIIGLDWYSGQEGYCEPGCPVLAICLRTGQLQLMKDEMDETCLLITTGMQASNIKWNSNGSVLAVSGVVGNSGGPEAAVLHFYSCNGTAVHIPARCACMHQLLLSVLANVLQVALRNWSLEASSTCAGACLPLCKEAASSSLSARTPSVPAGHTLCKQQTSALT